MFQIYCFCRDVDDIADSDGPRDERLAALAAMARRHRRALSRTAAGAARGLVASVNASTCSTTISSPSSTAWKWTCRRTSARPTSQARPLLRPRRERGRPPVGARVRPARGRRHRARASSRPRAAAHQHPARHRRGCRARPALSAARTAAAAGITETTIRSMLPTILACQVCAPLVERARKHFAKADQIMGRTRAAACARRASWRGIMARSSTLDRARLCAAARAGPGEKSRARHRAAQRRDLMAPTVHIIGAGLAGLSAAVRLPSAAIVVHVHEATHRPAAAAAPITMPRPVSPSTTAIICCCRAIATRWPTRDRSAPKPA